MDEIHLLNYHYARIPIQIQTGDTLYQADRGLHGVWKMYNTFHNKSMHNFIFYTFFGTDSKDNVFWQAKHRVEIVFSG